MKRLVLALVVLAGVTADVQAGPIRNIIARFQHRRAERHAPAYSSCQPSVVAAVPSCSTCPTAAPVQTVPGSCPGGQCPLPRRVVEVPTPSASAEPTVVVFASPRRMP